MTPPKKPTTTINPSASTASTLHSSPEKPEAKKPTEPKTKAKSGPAVRRVLRWTPTRVGGPEDKVEIHALSPENGQLEKLPVKVENTGFANYEFPAGYEDVLEFWVMGPTGKEKREVQLG